MENQGFLGIGSLQVSTSLKMTCVYHHSPALFTGTGFLMFRWREPLLLTPLPTASDIRVLKPLINCQFLPPLSAPPSSPAQKRSGFIIVTCGLSSHPSSPCASRDVLSACRRLLWTPGVTWTSFVCTLSFFLFHKWL